MPLNVMLDLETLGARPGSIILSIGACAFDTSSVLAQFHLAIDVRTCERAGLTMDAGTVLWWMGRGDAARRGGPCWTPMLFR